MFTLGILYFYKRIGGNEWNIYGGRYKIKVCSQSRLKGSKIKIN